MLKRLFLLSLPVVVLVSSFSCGGGDSSESRKDVPPAMHSRGLKGGAGSDGSYSVADSRGDSTVKYVRKAPGAVARGRFPDSTRGTKGTGYPAAGGEGRRVRTPGRRPGADRRAPSGEVVAVPVEVAVVGRRSVGEYILASTTLEALREVEVFAKTSGIVTSLLVEEGDVVNEGDTLVVIDDREAKLDLKKAEIAYREAESVLGRSKQMKSRNLISEEEYETALLSFERAKTELEAAKLAYDYTRVTAPINGHVVERFVELGDMVTQGKALFRMAEFNPLRARVHVPERDLGKLKVGQAAILEVESEPGRRFQGEVELISSVVDPGSGTFKVTIRVDSSGGLLRPGMFTSVKIVVDKHPNALVVPREAVLYEGEARYVYVVRDGVAERVPVKMGFSDEDFVEVGGDLSEGERVVVAGQNSIASGVKVDVVKTVGYVE